MVSNSLWRAADHGAVTVKNAPDGGGWWSHSCQNILLALAKQTKLCHRVSHWAKSQGWSCEGANIGKHNVGSVRKPTYTGPVREPVNTNAISWYITSQPQSTWLPAGPVKEHSRHLSPSRPHKKRTQLYTDMLGLYCSHVRQQHKTSLDMFIWQEKSKKARLTVLACLVGCTIRCLTPTYHSSKQACIRY
jgi:hypothetical protein